MSDIKILGSSWSTLKDGSVIGIVRIWNGHEEKAYIGLIKSPSTDEQRDVMVIAEHGVPFSLEAAKRIA